jgi:hypothetical protein
MCQKNKKILLYVQKIYSKVIREAKKLTSTMQIRASGNKAKAMQNLIKKELGTQKKHRKTLK